MAKSNENPHFKEKMRMAAKQSRQKTLDNVTEQSKKEPPQPTEPKLKRHILITDISTATKEDELTLKIEFKLFPSRTSFSKMTADLFFDTKKISTLHISILPSPLATETSEFSSALVMNGIDAGKHTIRVEMYELWSSGEKLAYTSKEVAIDYVPVKKEDRLIEIPIVKHSAGADLQVVTDFEKDVYRELDESIKRDQISQRDGW
jgi:hypothetical protein